MSSTHPIFLLYCLAFLLQKSYCSQIPDNDWNHHNHLQTRLQDHTSSSGHIEPDFTVFFHYKDLRVGYTMPIYFPKQHPSTTPRLLSRQESDSLPFSPSHLTHILKVFSFSPASKQADAIKTTLDSCQLPPLKDGAVFCATSRESMLDSVAQILGTGSQFEVVKTRYLSGSISPLQNYTISEAPMEMAALMSVACHMLPYPYAVYYCHGQYSDLNKIYKVLLVGEDGGRVEAAAVCHLDTSRWDPRNPAFGVLDTVPGATPICHFFPPDNLVWIPIS